jgi:hypothetical protein
MTLDEFRHRLASVTVAELHRLRRLHPRGRLLVLIEQEAAERERTSRPKGKTEFLHTISRILQ